MATEIADRFYKLWVAGQVTDRLIGQRFGYAVLEHYYGKRDWEAGVFESVEEQQEEETASEMSGGVEATADGDPVAPEPVAAVMSTAAGTAEESEALGEAPAMASDAAAAAAAAASGTGGTAGSPSSGTTERRVEDAVLTGSRQTSLAHWLL